MPVRTKKIVILSAIVAIIILGAFLIRGYTKGIVGLPFGGKVITSFPCPCSGNFLLTISPPMGGQFIYVTGSQAYLNFNLPMTGVWALGLYTPGGVCLVPSHKGCSPFGLPGGTITPTVGTSLSF